jgi:hypothetical protein
LPPLESKLQATLKNVQGTVDHSGVYAELAKRLTYMDELYQQFAAESTETLQERELAQRILVDLMG